MNKINQTSVSARRKLLKSLTLGGATVAALPAEWTKPALQAVVLPAHSETTDGSGSGSAPGTTTAPVGKSGPGSDLGSGFFGGFALENSTNSFSMSITAHADIACGNSAVVTARSPTGAVIGQCSSGAAGSGNELVSFSCSADGLFTPNLSDSALITFTIVWENGCACSWTTLMSNESGSVFSRESTCT